MNKTGWIAGIVGLLAGYTVLSRSSSIDVINAMARSQGAMIRLMTEPEKTPFERILESLTPEDAEWLWREYNR